LYQTRIAIECKRYARTVGIDKVEAFATKLGDLGVDQGVMVSATGFNSGAKASARDNRITLLTYREASGLDWAEVTKSGAWLSFIVSRRNVRTVEAETPNGHRVLSESAQIFPEPGVVLSISDVVQGVLHDLTLPERPGEYTIGVDALGEQRATDNGLNVDVRGFRLDCQVRSFEYIVNLTLAGGHVLADSQTGSAKYQEFTSASWDMHQLLASPPARELTAEMFDQAMAERQQMGMINLRDAKRFFRVVVTNKPSSDQAG
jgi:hypothetical protein